jgi:hypothetical protein
LYFYGRLRIDYPLRMIHKSFVECNERETK